MELHIDFELRSRCELKTRGTWNYSIDPSTEILCLQYAIDDGEPILSYPPINGLPGHNWPPHQLIELSQRPDVEIHAHNAFFERCIWLNICHKRLGWPTIDPMKWRCTLAVCAYHALPRSLEHAGKALDLKHQKDMKGAKALEKFMKPMKNGEWYWNLEDFKKLCDYCGTDVRVEREIGKVLGPLPPYELKIWLLDQKINEYGILFDKELARQAIRIAESEKARANMEIYELTSGAVKTTSGQKDYKEWAAKQGFDFAGKSISKDTIPDYLADPKMPGVVKESLKIKTRVSMASVNKYKAILNLMDPEGVVRDTLRYGGAGTMRWAGKGVQIQNFPRGYGKEMDEICTWLGQGSPEMVETFYGDKPMAALKKATRGSIIARPGKEIIAADYSAIEARGLMWAVGDERAMSVLSKSCIYCDMASSIYGYEVRKKDHPSERQLGKAAILGLGYEMGYPKFFLTLQKDRVTLGERLVRQLVGDQFEDLKKFVAADSVRIAEMGIDVKAHWIDLIGCKFIVDTYRARYPLVRAWWKELENAAREAIKNPNEVIRAGKVSYVYDSGKAFLQAILPSGRSIHYFRPGLDVSYAVTFFGKNAKGREVKLRLQRDKISGTEADIAAEALKKRGFELVSSEPDIWESEKIHYLRTDKGGKLFKSQLYSGLLAENNIQAISRDLIGEAMVRAYDRGYQPIMTVHDELAIETEIGKISVHDFEKLICELPDWAKGFPIAAEGFVCRRYRK